MSIHNPNRVGHPSNTRNGAVSKDTFAEILNGFCPRIQTLMHTEHGARFGRFVDAEAWTDAALALLALELPQWKLRRLAYDDGEWHCALSDNRDMPDWLDASAEAHHADISMAILCAIIDVKTQRSHLNPAKMGSSVIDPSFEAMSCDNFA